MARRRSKPAPEVPPVVMNEAPATVRRRTTILVVASLLIGHYAAAVASLVRENPTVDEVNHLPAGLSYWQTGSFRLYHHNPPLIKMAAALPVFLSGADMAEAYKSPYWNLESVPPAQFGSSFLILNATRYFSLFTRARMVMPLFSVLGGWVVFAWSRRLFGDRGGMLSLALWCLCPNILAHARLVTSDLGATSLGALATYAFWIYLGAPTWKRAVLAGIALGIAELSKFSMLLLYPLWPILWVGFLVLQTNRPGFFRSLRIGIRDGLIILGMSIVVINLGYGFEGFGRPLGDFKFASRSSLLTREGTTVGKSANELIDKSWKHRVNRYRETWMGSIPVPLPAHYLLGFDEQKIEADGVPRTWLDPLATDPGEIMGYVVYLDGVLRRTGWRSYYARAVLYKTPEGTIALMGLAAALFLFVRRSRVAWRDEIVILTVPLAFFGLMTFLTDINIGLRYVLPAFPYAFIFAGRLGRWADGFAGRGRKLAWALVAIPLVAMSVATAMIHPHYLAYFNAASGGPDRMPPRLIDSNLDWGQDLVGLREWLRGHPDEGPVGLIYFGQVPPSLFRAWGDGFDWFLPPGRPGHIQPMTSNPDHLALLVGPSERVTPGLYAVSASIVQGLSWRVYDPSRKMPTGTWNALEDAFGYFRAARPFATIGHSILLYRLSPRDAERLERERLKR